MEVPFAASVSVVVGLHQRELVNAPPQDTAKDGGRFGGEGEEGSGGDGGKESVYGPYEAERAAGGVTLCVSKSIHELDPLSWQENVHAVGSRL